MPIYENKAELPYTVEQLYRMVADVASYPEFLPWCRASRICQGNPDPMAGQSMIAEILVQFSMLRESYISKVCFVPPAIDKPKSQESASIIMTLVDGPFHHMDSQWVFTQTGAQQCQLHFHIDFAFKSRLLKMTAEKAFLHAAKAMMTAFCQRADVLYQQK